MDPLPLVAAAAAVGGAAGKFVEKAWDCGEKWLASYFQNHKEKAQEQARINASDFLNCLANQLRAMEDSGEVDKDEIEIAQDHPDFSVLLQKALISSSQTESAEKHAILARLVADRLRAQPESILSLASKMACDAVSLLNTTQLKVLALCITVLHVRPIGFAPEGLSNEDFDTRFGEWLEEQLQPYTDLQFSQLDLIHLESASCLKSDPVMTRDLGDALCVAGPPGLSFDVEKFRTSNTGAHVADLWSKGLDTITLTSVGTIIGVYVSDILTGSSTTLRGWD